MDFHPFLTHFPIAILVFYTLTEIVNSFVPRKEILRISLFLLVAGVVMLFPALLTGNMAAQRFIDSALELELVKTEAVSLHEDIATLTVIFFSIVFIAKIKTLFRAFKAEFNYSPTIQERSLNFILAIVGCILIFLTGYFGGVLVYIHGIGVAH